MKQLVTEAIILSRTDYGEADRILTLLTPAYGKLSLMAKGVRRIKSKLAGGIELFSVSTITYTPGRGSVGTLISTRLVKHYGRIVADLDRTMLGYELIRQLNKATEDEPEPEYFELLGQAFAALDDPAVPLPLIQLWFTAQLLRQAGHTPNLHTDTQGRTLDPVQTYDFAYERMCFSPAPGRGDGFGVDHIKFLRLSFAGHSAAVLARVRGSAGLVQALAPLVTTMRQTYLRV